MKRALSLLLVLAMLLALNGGAEYLSSSKLKVGQTITMGTYDTDGKSSTRDKLTWRVLAVSGHKALVITEDIIHCGSYFNPSWIKYKYTYWSGSYIGTAESVNYRGSGPATDKTRFKVSKYKIPLKNGGYGSDDDLYQYHARYWLNKVFYKNAVSSSEKKRIVRVENENKNNPQYGVKGGPATKDYVFFLSYDEVLKYMPNRSDRTASFTAKARSENSSSEKSPNWWLRSPGKYRVNAMYVSGRTGSISVSGSDVGHSDVGYRPAMWITF